MSYISPQGEQSTSTEITTLANLTALAVSASGKFLRKTGTTTFESAALSEIVTLDGLSDVSLSSLTNGQILAYNGTSWVNSSEAGAGTVTSVSITTANGVSGSVATATTTPAISLTLGAITPSSIALGAGSITMTGSIATTGARVTKGWFTDIETTNALVGNITGTAATVTGAAQTAITSLGTLTILAVDDITINGNTISSTGASTLAIIPTAGQAITFDGTITLDAGVIAGATSITSTTFVGALTGNATTATDTVAKTGTGSTYATNTSPTFTGTVTIPTPFTIGAVSMTATGTELNYVAGVTSAIQTQLGTKAPLASPTFTGTVTMPVSLTGVLRADTGVVSVDSDITDLVSASSLTLAGKVELATTAEIDTGTDSTRAIPVDQFVASTRNVRFLDFYLIDSATDLTVGTGKGGNFECPFTGTITAVGAYVNTAGTTNASVIDINKAGTTIMTTNKCSIDSAEVSTRTAATPPTLTTTAITAGDLISFDIDSLSTTVPKGLHVRIEIRLT